MQIKYMNKIILDNDNCYDFLKKQTKQSDVLEQLF